MHHYALVPQMFDSIMALMAISAVAIIWLLCKISYEGKREEGATQRHRDRMVQSIRIIGLANTLWLFVHYTPGETLHQLHSVSARHEWHNGGITLMYIAFAIVISSTVWAQLLRRYYYDHYLSIDYIETKIIDGKETVITHRTAHERRWDMYEQFDDAICRHNHFSSH